MSSQLAKLVKKYYPNEAVIDEKKAEFYAEVDTVLGLKFRGIYSSTPLKIPIVETNSMFIFDIRPIYYSIKPWLSKINLINAIISLFVLLFGGYLVLGITLYFIRNLTIFGIFTLVVFYGSIPLILRIPKSIAFIIAIKKDWISKYKEKGGVRTITWSLPENYKGFSFVHLMNDDSQNKLSINTKLLSGLLLSKVGSHLLRRASPVKSQNIVFKIKKEL